MTVGQRELISNVESWVASLGIRENIGIMSESTISTYYRLQSVRLRGTYNGENREFLNSVRENILNTVSNGSINHKKTRLINSNDTLGRI